MENIKIYCDMDGVLTDFEAKAMQTDAELFEKMRDGCKKSEGNFWKCVHEVGPDWWASMDWLEDGRHIWDYIEDMNPQILTALPRTGQDLVRQGKKAWLRKNINDLVSSNAITTFGSYGKAEHAKPNTILIDDRPKNCEAFRKAGGNAVLHEYGKTGDTLRRFEVLRKKLMEQRGE